MVKLLNSPFLVWYFTYQTGNPDLVKERKQVFFLRASWGSSRGRFCFCNVPPSPSSGVRELCRHREHCHPLVTQHALWWLAALRLTQGSDRHLLVEQPLPALAHRLLFFFSFGQKRMVKTFTLLPKHLMKFYYRRWSVFSSLNESPWIKRWGVGNPGEIHES